MLMNQIISLLGGFHLPKSLKKDAISCRWMTIVGDMVILELYISSRRWLAWFFPDVPSTSWPLALLSRRPLLTWKEREVLGLTRTVVEGGVWHHPCVCFIVLPFRSSAVKRCVCWEEMKEVQGWKTWWPAGHMRPRSNPWVAQPEKQIRTKTNKLC